MNPVDSINAVLQGTNGTADRSDSTGELWPFRHYQLVSLGQLLRFYAKRFVHMYEHLASLEDLARQNAEKNPRAMVGPVIQGSIERRHPSHSLPGMLFTT
jgi:hypothetical protein